MELWRGAPVAARIYETEQPVLAALAEKGVKPTLAVVRVGEREDDLSYERGLKKAAGDKIDLKIVALPEDVSAEAFYAALADLNADNAVHGILIFRPLPKSLRGNVNLEAAIPPEKDVDGMTAVAVSAAFRNVGDLCSPCTAQAVIEMLDFYGVELKGKRVTVVGRSLVVGKPLSMLLLNRNATVTVCHTGTADLAAECRRADIVVACAGARNLVAADGMSEGQVLVDVGIHVDENGLCGDINQSDAEAANVAALTPVPGGLGPVTNAVLIRNVIEAAKKAAQIV